jgi:Domain of unknown function (DUF4352)
MFQPKVPGNLRVQIRGSCRVRSIVGGARRHSRLVLFGLACQARPNAEGEQARAMEARAVTALGALVPMGSLGRAPHYEMSVLGSEECAGHSRGRPEDGLIWGVDVTVRASNDLQVPANPYYALLIDKENRVFEAVLDGCRPALDPGLLRPGETAQGWISFALPRAASRLKLVYSPALTSGVPEELSFAAGR